MTKIDINILKQMFERGAQIIAENFEYIDELNIFPVPDGDTGSNLKVTTEGAINAVKNKSYIDLKQFGKDYSLALLMNARGNSGVIFSQIIKGFVINFKPDTDSLSLVEIIECFKKAVEYAYKAVTDPIEGTILTVIRVTSEEITNNANSFKSVEELFAFAVTAAENILNETPNMLQDLKNAGVVDSGGYGLFCFLTGMSDVLNNKESVKKVMSKKSLKKKDSNAIITNFEDKNEGFGYCCEFIFEKKAKVTINQKDKMDFDLPSFKREYERIGNCLVVVEDDNIVKVHIHTTAPYLVLQIAQKYGEFVKVKIENMTMQFLKNNPGATLGGFDWKNSSVKNNNVHLSNDTKVIITCPTKKLSDLFVNEFKVDYVINYENSGNPSIQEFFIALQNVKSSRIILIVDDSNAILASTQAIQLLNKKIKAKLINSRDIAVTYKLCLAYNPYEDFDDNVDNLNQLSHSRFGKLAIASKSVINGKIKVNSGDYIGIIDKTIISSNKNVFEAAKVVINSTIHSVKLKKIVSPSLKIFAGIDANQADIRKFEKYVSENYSINTMTIYTDQKNYVYHFII